MRVPVDMRLTRRVQSGVPVRMMLVVPVPMAVLDRLMLVVVLVILREMEVDADPHQRGRDRELRADRISEHEDRDQRASERRASEVGAGARGPEVTQREHEQDEAQPVA